MAMDGGPVEICFSLYIDYNVFYVNIMKAGIINLTQKLHANIPGIRIGICTHGDDCSTKNIDFSTNVHDLCEWLNVNKMTTGRDVDGCYEHVLKEVHSLSWTPGSKRALVMIGDSDPHEPGHTYGTHTCNVDWKDEAIKLMQMNIRVYGVYWGCRSLKDLFENISVSTGGKCFPSYKFEFDLVDTLMEMPYLKHDNAMLQIDQTEVYSKVSTMPKDIGSVCKRLRRADTIDIDTVAPSPMKQKHSPSKVLGPTSKTTVKTLKRIYTTRSNAKRKRVMVDKELVEKYKLTNLRKLKRENVPESNFMLKDAPWTEWQLAITPELGDGTESNLWVKRRGHLIGYRRKVVCGGNYKAALYEFSVQQNRGCKRYVVYCRTNKGFILKKGSWESKLLNKPDVKFQIEDVLKKGCRLYIRRYLVNKASNWEKTLGYRDHYDYAWSCPRYRKTQRLVPYKLYS